jgi:hypothetical protein
VKDCHPAIEYPSVKRFQLIFKRSPFKHIGNVDETAVYFIDMPRNYTAGAKGAKEVKIRRTDYEAQRVTVMLHITDDGHNYHLVLLSIAKTIHTNEMLPVDVTVRAQNKWMDDG